MALTSSVRTYCPKIGSGGGCRIFPCRGSPTPAGSRSLPRALLYSTSSWAPRCTGYDFTLPQVWRFRVYWAVTLLTFMSRPSYRRKKQWTSMTEPQWLSQTNRTLLPRPLPGNRRCWRRQRSGRPSGSSFLLVLRPMFQCKRPRASCALCRIGSVQGPVRDLVWPTASPRLGRRYLSRCE